MTTALLYIILAFAAGGAAMFAVFGALALLAMHSAELDLSLVVAELARLATMPLLRTLPMFALAGYLLAESRASERLLRVSRAAFGWMPGSLPIVALVTTTFFTAFTGASGVTIVALGGLLLPALLKEGYQERFSMGIVTTGGNMGVLFIPSLPIILYAVIANPIAPAVTIDRMFRAALLPGFLSVAALAVYGVWVSARAHIPRHVFSWRELGAAIWAAKWELPMPFVVIGGIYSGKLVVGEAAVITAAYVLIVEMFFYREIHPRRLPDIICGSMVLVGGVLIILGLGMAITNYLVDQEVPMHILQWVQARFHSPWTFLIAVNLLLLLVGCMMDIYTATVVVVPLLLPVGIEFGIDPVHMGVIFLANLAIGYSTPPVGMNLFLASLRFEKPLLRLAAASIPFMLVLLLMLLVITYLPELSLALAPSVTSTP